MSVKNASAYSAGGRSSNSTRKSRSLESGSNWFRAADPNTSRRRAPARRHRAATSSRFWAIGFDTVASEANYAFALVKTGTPFTVFSGSDAPGYGNVDGDQGDRPNILDPSILGRTIGHPDTSRALLPTAAFSYIAPTDLRGNLGSNTFRKAGIANVNLSLQRAFTLPSDLRLQLRAEAVNAFNTPQFAEPWRELSSPSFGFITNTLNDGRAFRFQLRLSF